MKKILMVCLGNICRSPMAEGLMKEKIEKYGLDAVVDSAGFEPYHKGDHPDHRAQHTLFKHNINISAQRSRLFNVSDFDKFDHIFVMDRYNFQDIKSVARNAQDLAKVDFLLNTVYPGSNKEVPDPYYSSADGFEKVFQMIDEATEIIAEKLLKEESKK
jgi:protein-tyrosine phosphatase